MNALTPTEKKIVWCAIYVRKSTEENLNTEFNSLDAQEEYCRSFIKARGAEGWLVCPEIYKDPGYTGGNMDRLVCKSFSWTPGRESFRSWSVINTTA